MLSYFRRHVIVILVLNVVLLFPLKALARTESAVARPVSFVYPLCLLIKEVLFASR